MRPAQASDGRPNLAERGQGCLLIESSFSNMIWQVQLTLVDLGPMVGQFPAAVHPQDLNPTSLLRAWIQLPGLPAESDPLSTGRGDLDRPPHCISDFDPHRLLVGASTRVNDLLCGDDRHRLPAPAAGIPRRLETQIRDNTVNSRPSWRLRGLLPELDLLPPFDG